MGKCNASRSCYGTLRAALEANQQTGGSTSHSALAVDKPLLSGVSTVPEPIPRGTRFDRGLCRVLCLRNTTGLELFCVWPGQSILPEPILGPFLARVLVKGGVGMILLRDGLRLCFPGVFLEQLGAVCSLSLVSLRGHTFERYTRNNFGGGRKGVSRSGGSAHHGLRPRRRWRTCSLRPILRCCVGRVLRAAHFEGCARLFAVPPCNRAGW